MDQAFLRQGPMVPAVDERWDIDAFAIVGQASARELVRITSWMDGALALERITHSGADLQPQRGEAIEEAGMVDVTDRRQPSRLADPPKAKQIQRIGRCRVCRG